MTYDKIMAKPQTESSKESIKVSVLVNCENCGKPFHVPRYKLWLRQCGIQHSLSCSRGCAYELRQNRPVLSRRRRVILTCELCGKEFEETSVHADMRRFCSIACKAEYQRTALAGEGNTYYGRKHSKETRQRISTNHFRSYGKDNPNWHGGVTELKVLIRKSKKYKQWRNAVYQRDHYRSSLSGKRGRSSELVAHHKKPFIEILNEMLALYPNLSPERDASKLCEIAMNYAPLWEIENGVTLLYSEHTELHSAQNSHDDED